MAKQKSTQETSETVIYCGPTLPSSKLVAKSVFRNGLPPYVQKLVDENPDIRMLIVPLGSFAETLKRAMESGTEENRLYCSVMNMRKEGA